MKLGRASTVVPIAMSTRPSSPLASASGFVTFSSVASSAETARTSTPSSLLTFTCSVRPASARATSIAIWRSATRSFRLVLSSVPVSGFDSGSPGSGSPSGSVTNTVTLTAPCVPTVRSNTASSVSWKLLASSGSSWLKSIPATEARTTRSPISSR